MSNRPDDFKDNYYENDNEQSEFDALSEDEGFVIDDSFENEESDTFNDESEPVQWEKAWNEVRSMYGDNGSSSEDIQSAPHEKEQENRSLVHEVYEWMDAVIAAIVAVVLIFTFLFRVVGVEGKSMLNTLYNFDKVIISDLMFEPEYGDIVVISRNYLNDETIDKENQNEPIIKRVIAVGGQTIDIDKDTGEVTVDGAGLNEKPYLEKEDGYISKTDPKTNFEFPLVVPEDHIFVMGDNREHSLDSRSSEIGMVDKRYVLGHAVLRVWPLSSFGSLTFEND